MKQIFSSVQANAFLLSPGKHIVILMCIYSCIVSIVMPVKDKATLAVSLNKKPKSGKSHELREAARDFIIF